MSGHDLTADDFLGKVQFNHRLQTPRNSLVPGRPIEDVKKMSTSNGPRRGTDYRVAVNLPNGDKAKLFGRAGMSVESLIQPLVHEYQWSEYRVVLSSSRAPVNLEDSSAVVDGKEIDVEDVAALRQKAGLEILESEREYLKSLNGIIEVYAEPLKKWRLHAVSQDTLFSGIYSLRTVSQALVEELTYALDHWSEQKTCVGSILQQQPGFPGKFEEYSYSYTKAARLLKEKKTQQHDNGFTAYVAALRGNAVHSLESLLLVPNHRIKTYGKLLSDLLYATPSTHHDHSQLQKVSASVAQLLDRRTEAIMYADNQAKLEYMQARFTQQLHLNRPLDYLFQPAKRKKNTASSTITSPTPDYLMSCGDVQVSDTKPGKSPMKQEQVTRRYVQEGPVQLTLLSKSITKDRYLFLLSDVLFTAKCKATATTSSNSFNLKDRQRLSDVWVAQCPDDLQAELSDYGLEPHCSFLIGWPICNMVATFSSPKEKEMWFSLMKKETDTPIVSSQPVSVCIFNKATVSSSSYTPKKYVEVAPDDTTKDVIDAALEQFKIEDDSHRYCLWVSASSAKEDDLFLLLGHEKPYAIKFYMNRRWLDVPSAEESRQPQASIPRQFVLRTAQRTPYFSGEKPQKARRLNKKSVSSALVHKFFRSRAKDSTATPNRTEVTASFGQPLNKVISPDLPPWLQIALVRLYIDGPQTDGILRKSANAKRIRMIREAIDDGMEPDIASEPTLLLGALLKDFLRNIPGYILNGDLYTEWVACLDPEGDEPKIKQVRRMLERLPQANQSLLHNVFVTFAKITENHEVNQMHSENVAICVSPSLLSPADDMQVLRNEVPPLIQFMVEHCSDVFEGFETPAVVRAAEAIRERSNVETLESPEFSSDMAVSDPNLRSTFLSSSNEFLAEDDPVAVNHSSSSLTGSTPILTTEDSSSHMSMMSQGETSASSGTGPSLSSSVQIGGSDTSSFTPSPQLPRVNLQMPSSSGQDARVKAAAWRGFERAAGNSGSPAGSRLVVERHRQAQQRALEAQQAAPTSSGSSVSDTNSSLPHVTSRTKLHPSASMFVDQLGRSPGMSHRHTTADLDSDAAASTRNLQELYEIYSVKGHGKQINNRASLPLAPAAFSTSSASLPTTPSHSSKLQAIGRRSSEDQPAHHSEQLRRSLTRHWYSVDETSKDDSTGPTSPRQPPPPPPPPGHQPPQLVQQHRPSARVAPADALFAALNEKLGLGPPVAPQSRQEWKSEELRRRPQTSGQFDDSSSGGSSEESDDGQPERSSYLSSSYSQHQQQQHTRSLEKRKGHSTTAPMPAEAHSSNLYSRRSSFPTQPARVKTKAFVLPTPRQPVFENIKFDEESYV